MKPLTRQPSSATLAVPSIEWLTLSMVLLNYSAWFGLLSLYSRLPWLVIPLLGLCLAWQLSLQHELIHGHPTRHDGFNDLLGSPPITLIYPYRDYKRTHLAHHRDEDLTLPDTDPESYFVTLTAWRGMSAFARACHRANMTLSGRLLLGPIRSLLGVLRLAYHGLMEGNTRERLHWLLHGLGVAAVLWLAHAVFSMPIWAYLLSVHIAHALISLRSFYEHRVAKDPQHRIVVVESGLFFRLLYLSNNYHAVHHRYPRLPWYRIETRYRKERDKILQANGGFHFHGYRDWLRYLLRPVASPVFPERLCQPGTLNQPSTASRP